jgi:hypothetical protein
MEVVYQKFRMVVDVCFQVANRARCENKLWAWVDGKVPSTAETWPGASKGFQIRVARAEITKSTLEIIYIISLLKSNSLIKIFKYFKLNYI